MGICDRHHARTAGDADCRRWPHVHDGRMERGVRTRREDRQAALDLRPPGAACVGSQCLLRCRESRRGGVAGRDLRRHARRPPGVARRAHGQEALGSEHHRPHQALHHHGGAARREGQGADRQRRGRVWRARLLFRLRRRHRQAGLAFLHGAGQPERRLRTPRDGGRRQDVDRRMVARWWRRHGVGLDGLRPAARHAVRRHRQWFTVGARDPLAGRRRQSLPVVHPCARSGRRAPEVALPDDAEGELGLHGHPAHHPCGPELSTANRARC